MYKIEYKKTQTQTLTPPVKMKTCFFCYRQIENSTIIRHKGGYIHICKDKEDTMLCYKKPEDYNEDTKDNFITRYTYYNTTPTITRQGDLISGHLCIRMEYIKKTGKESNEESVQHIHLN